MPIIRLILNNGFFILFLVIATSVYLAYSTDPDFMKIDLTSDQNEVVTEQSKPVEEPKQAAVKPAEEVAVEKPTAVKATPEKQEVKAEAPVKAENTTAEVKPAPETESPKVTEPAEKTPVVEAKKEEVSTEVAEAPKTEDTKPAVAAVTKSVEVAKSAPADTNTNKEVLKAYPSYQAALADARKAFYDKDMAKAEKIYVALASTTRSPQALGEFGNVLHANNKPKLAEKAWVEAGDAMIKQNRGNDALTLANRLATVSPKASKTIRDNVSNVMSQRQTEAKARQEKLRQSFLAQQKAQKAAQQEQAARQEAKRKADEQKRQAYQKELQAYQAKMKAYYDKMRSAKAPQIPARQAVPNNQQAMDNYRKQMAEYQAKLKAYYDSRKTQQPRSGQPAMSQTEYQKRMDTYRKQMAEYQEKMRQYQSQRYPRPLPQQAPR